MKKDIQKSQNSCKNCSHDISLHKPTCLFETEDNDANLCGCKDAQYYNTIVSDKYIGWIEIHYNDINIKNDLKCVNLSMRNGRLNLVLSLFEF